MKSVFAFVSTGLFSMYMRTPKSYSDTSIPAPTGPSVETIHRAKELAKNLHKYLDLDFWKDSVEKKVIIGVFENLDKILLKTEDGKTSDEYSSLISKIYRSCNEYIVVAQYAVYVVDSSIPGKKITSDNPFVK